LGAIELQEPDEDKCRVCHVASVAMIVCEGLFSMVFFWPRNTIMFVESPAVHATEILIQRHASPMPRLELASCLQSKSGEVCTS
jgi:hypothetical protein